MPDRYKLKCELTEYDRVAELMIDEVEGNELCEKHCYRFEDLVLELINTEKILQKMTQNE